jgi:signal transduction histidine kinase
MPDGHELPERAVGDELSTAGEQLPLLETLDHVDHGIALTDGEGRVRWCNALLLECYLRDRSPEAWCGRPYAEIFEPLFFEPAHWRRVEAALARLPHAPKGRVEIENVGVNWGGPAPRRIDLVLCDLGASEASPLPGWVAWYFYDLTAFRKCEENLQALLRHSTDGIFMIDADCRLRVFNEACERITGWRADEVLHRDATCNLIFLCSDPACTCKQAQNPCSNDFCFVRENGGAPREMSIKTKQGRSVWVEVSFAPVADEAGRVAYVLGILRDVTQRRQLEDQLRLTRKLATLGELTSAVAHEIKNPLGIIMSAAEIVTNPSRPESQRRQAADFIREEVKRLDERIKVFLNFSRPRPPEFKPQSIHRVLTQTVFAYDTLARTGLRIETDFAPELPEVRIDADQMQQVFLNLLVNADQAMPAGGTITVATRRGEGERILVEVADEGVGLPEDTSRLFEPFFSTKPQGTGLGLAIALHIVSAHGGTIEARNRNEGGAIFTVSLPITGPDGQGPGSQAGDSR